MTETDNGLNDAMIKLEEEIDLLRAQRRDELELAEKQNMVAAQELQLTAKLMRLADAHNNTQNLSFEQCIRTATGAVRITVRPKPRRGLLGLVFGC